MVVERNPGSKISQEDPYLHYKGWSLKGFDGMNTSGVNYLEGGEVFAPYVENDIGGAKKLVMGRFYSTRDHQALTSNRPVSAEWQGGAFRPGYLDFDVTGDTEQLPTGVACQLINDPKVGSTNAKLDRYVRTGAILFDAQGRLVSQEMVLSPNSAIGELLQMTEEAPPVNIRVRTQLGVVVYDLEHFKNEGFTENDYVMPIASLGPRLAGYDRDEEREEAWLDFNAYPMSVGRYTAAIMKGE
jgi:hypothetical protein